MKKLVAIVIGAILGVGISCVVKKEVPVADAGVADATVAVEPPMIKADPNPSPKEVVQSVATP